MPTEARTAFGRRIYQTAHITGQFTLRSGATSTEYFDKYLFEADPKLLKAIAEAMVPLVPSGIDALAGLEMGGIPIATMLSQLTGLPLLFVRKKAKDYGTCKIAEGGLVRGRRMLMVEDVVTSGGAILDAAKALRDEGAVLGPVVCVIDRESGGPANLAKSDLILTSLFTMSELKKCSGGL
jgi:orotate phosphoribosyltransferase